VEFEPVFFLMKIEVSSNEGYGGGETCHHAALCRVPWFIWTMITHRGELAMNSSVETYIITSEVMRA
jgi:hypothetical protein